MVVSTQAPLQAWVPAGQPQLPAVQASCGLHALPHPPQWSGSVAGSTHRPPQASCPAGQAQAPAVQTWPAGQAFPQAPQLARSTNRSLQASWPVPHRV